jgi:glycosyltransferase involved in cell wall biosynthesis
MARVLIVGRGAPERGGIPSFIQLLLEGELAAEHQMQFLNLAHGSEPAGGQLTLANIRRTVADCRAVWRAARGADIVHVHSAVLATVTCVRAGLLALVGRLRGARTVVHAHGGKVQLWLVNRRARLIARLCLGFVDRVVAVSTAGGEALRAALGDTVVLVDNGVDHERFRPTGAVHSPPRVLYVGLLTDRKGVIDLLEASADLTRRGVRHELWLVGGTPDEGRGAEAVVRSAAAAAGDHVRLLGSRSPEQMPAAYQDADVFCLPSWWEAMPLSVLEAMASGLAVVACDVGDVARAVVDGQTGFVIPPRDRRALTAALERVLADPALRAALGSAGRHRVEASFTAAVTRHRVGEIYNDLSHSAR